MDSEQLIGYIAIFVSVFFYGSYFVPARKYEIYDGLVFQWYQCSGIMLMGVICAGLRNNWWSDTPSSTGYYVAPEGLLSGFIFQLANVVATRSVKSFGLGLYFTTHQVTNLFTAFLVGVLGHKVGLPTKPPGSIPVAGLGFFFVLVGMVPVMYMKKEAPDSDSGADVPLDAAGASDTAGVSSEGTSAKAPSTRSPAGAGNAASSSPTSADAAGAAQDPVSSSPLVALFDRDAPESARRHSKNAVGQRPSALPPVPTSPLESLFDRDAPDGRSRATTAPARRVHARSFEAPDEAPVMRIRSQTDVFWTNAHTWDGSLGRPYLGPGHSPGHRKIGDGPISCFSACGLVAAEDVCEEDVPAENGLEAPLVESVVISQADRTLSRWLMGLGLSLLAGFLYSAMYVPLLGWQERMQNAGHKVSGVDSFFSLCVGLYVCSSFQLVAVGAWMRFRGQRMEKSVLRPALFSGGLYALACQANLYAMMVLPYAVAYALGCGGALAVSQAWGTFYFGEAKSTYNRRCVVCSFAAVLTGIVFLGLSAG